MIKNNRYFWSHLKTKTVTISVTPPKRRNGVVFRVGNMIDLGNGRQTVMLEHVDYPKTYYNRKDNDGVAVPFRMGNFDFVYTSRDQPKMQHVHSLISSIYKTDEVEKIVADVLSPGDLLVFTQDGDTMKIKMVQALRVVKENSYKKSCATHAL